MRGPTARRGRERLARPDSRAGSRIARLRRHFHVQGPRMSAPTTSTRTPFQYDFDAASARPIRSRTRARPDRARVLVAIRNRDWAGPLEPRLLGRSAPARVPRMHARLLVQGLEKFRRWRSRRSLSTRQRSACSAWRSPRPRPFAPAPALKKESRRTQWEDGPSPFTTPDTTKSPAHVLVSGLPLNRLDLLRRALVSTCRVVLAANRHVHYFTSRRRHRGPSACSTFRTQACKGPVPSTSIPLLDPLTAPYRYTASDRFRADGTRLRQLAGERRRRRDRRGRQLRRPSRNRVGSCGRPPCAATRHSRRHLFDRPDQRAAGSAFLAARSSSPRSPRGPARRQRPARVPATISTRITAARRPARPRRQGLTHASRL